jgi:hypothetical protein
MGVPQVSISPPACDAVLRDRKNEVTSYTLYGGHHAPKAPYIRDIFGQSGALASNNPKAAAKIYVLMQAVEPYRLRYLRLS